MSTDDVVEKISNILIESENFANDFLPLKETLQPIKENLNSALGELKEKSDIADEISDKIFYLNRYTDLVKKVEGVFDSRSKRLQQTLAMISKMPIQNKESELSEDNNSVVYDNKPLTPEQANEIMMILDKNKGDINNE